MDYANFFRTLYDSNYWGVGKIIGAAEGMSDEEYGAANNYSHNNIREILTHTLMAETMYLSRLTGRPLPDASSPDAISEANLPSVEALKARWARHDETMRAYVDKLDDGELDRIASWVRRDGVSVSMPVWQVLTQIHEHGLQHRAEAAEALTLVGRSPGNLDFIVYIEELGPKP
jgi:uncharacterized damage-inducible protein DinB